LIFQRKSCKISKNKGGEPVNKTQTDTNTFLKLDLLGHVVTDLWWAQEEHTHDFYELLYLLKGNLTIKSQQQTLSVTQGQWVLIPKGLAHSMVAKDIGSFFYMGFDTNLLETSPFSLQILSSEKCGEIEGLTQFAQETVEQTFAENTDFSMYIPKAVATLLTFLCQEKAFLPSPDTKEILCEKIKDYIHRHLHQPIRVETMALALCHSPQYLAKVFTTLNGITIKEYALQQKMAKAVVLLAEKQNSINKVAALLGYDNANYFSKTFKGYYGFSPKELRNKDKTI
jgi:AraC-like DNA-binding protein